MEKFSSLLIVGFVERGKTARSRWMLLVSAVLLFLSLVTSDYGRGFWNGLTQ
jgi:hypothetical protein